MSCHQVSYQLCVLGESSYPCDPGSGCHVINNLILGDSGWMLGATSHHCGGLLLASPFLEVVTSNSTPSIPLPLGPSCAQVCTWNLTLSAASCHRQSLAGPRGQLVPSRPRCPATVHTSRTAFLCGTHIPITVPVHTVCTRVYYQLMSK